MPRDERNATESGTTGAPQRDGDNRPMKDVSTDAQKALDATSSEPRDLTTTGQEDGSADDQKRPST